MAARKKSTPTPELVVTPEPVETKDYNYFLNPPELSGDHIRAVLDQMTDEQRDQFFDEYTRTKRAIEQTALYGPKPTDEPEFVLSRAEKGSQRTFLMVTYPECKHEKRVEPYSTRDGEFMFRVPKHCPTCGDVYYYFVTDAKALKPLDNVPST